MVTGESVKRETSNPIVLHKNATPARVRRNIEGVSPSDDKKEKADKFKLVDRFRQYEYPIDYTTS